MDIKVLVISFILIMAFGYGSLNTLQGVEPTMIQKVILTSSGLIISNLVSRQWYKFSVSKK